MSNAIRRAALLAVIGGILGGIASAPGGFIESPRAGRPEDEARGEKIIPAPQGREENSPAIPAEPGDESRQVRRAQNRADRKRQRREEKKWRGKL